jgi:hypothetical protein
MALISFVFCCCCYYFHFRFQGIPVEAKVNKFEQLRSRFVRLFVRGTKYLSFAEFNILAGSVNLPAKVDSCSAQYHASGAWSCAASVDDNKSTCYGEIIFPSSALIFIVNFMRLAFCHFNEY